MSKRFRVLGGAAAVLAAGISASFLVPGAQTGPSQLYAQQARVAQEAREDLLIGAEKLSTAFRAAAKALRPSVVTITAKVDQPAVTRVMRRGSGQGFPEEFRGLIPDELLRQFGGPDIDSDDRLIIPDEDQPAPTPRKSQSQKIGVGSGVIVSKDGYLLTNNHVVAKADQLEVHLSDNRTLSAKVVGTDPKSDIAVLKIDAQGLVPAVLGDSSAMDVGDWVLAIGSPFELDQTVTAGIISAVNRSTQNDILPYEDFLQTDAAINPGNSGGPLVNLRGEVVGINTAINSTTGTNAGVGFAIPSNLAERIMQDLREGGSVKRGFIGAQLGEVSYEDLRKENIPDSVVDGVVIDAVQEGAPAAKAGLKKGDIVTQANGRDINSVSALRNTVAMVRPGKDLNLEIYRGGKPMQLSVTVEEFTEEKFAAMSPDVPVKELGVKVRTLTPDLAQNLEADIEEGAVVVALSGRGRAAQLRMQPGDIITELNGKKISTAADVVKAVEGSNKLLMKIYRDGQSMMLGYESR
jgi:serine protease Do